jgi:D-aminopeptidase
VFAAATGTAGVPDARMQALLGHVAATTLARAIARAVFAATPAPGDLLPTWGQRFSR